MYKVARVLSCSEHSLTATGGALHVFTASTWNLVLPLRLDMSDWWVSDVMNGNTSEQVHLQPLASRLEGSDFAYPNVWDVNYPHMICGLEGV